MPTAEDLTIQGCLAAVGGVGAAQAEFEQAVDGPIWRLPNVGPDEGASRSA